MPTTSERLLRLEKSRYRIGGEINAFRRLIITAWSEILLAQDGDPVAKAENVKTGLLAGADTPGRFTGVDAAEIEQHSAEYARALTSVMDELILRLRSQHPAK